MDSLGRSRPPHHTEADFGLQRPYRRPYSTPQSAPWVLPGPGRAAGLGRRVVLVVDRAHVGGDVGGHRHEVRPGLVVPPNVDGPVAVVAMVGAPAVGP